VKFLHPAAAQPEAADLLDLEHLMTDTRWQPLVDVLPDCIVLVDRTGLVRYINPAAESANEVLRVEVVGRSLQEFVRKSQLNLEFTLDAFANGVRGSRIVSAATSGQAYTASTRCIRDRRGNITCFLIVARSQEEVGQTSEGSANNTGLRDEVPSDPGLIQRPMPESVVLCETTAALVDRGLRTLLLGSRLLLLGESGVGKTEFARLLHRRSGNASRPFVHVNCGSIPETLFESEMFGYERGSFTGALARGKRGLVEAADGGILFLDEVGEIPLPSQAKMLQFLEEGGVQRVGGTQIKRLRLQIITATNRDLAKMVVDGLFRLDLFYRLSVVTLRLPPLRDCCDMLDELIDRFLDQVNQRRSKPLRLDRSCRQRLRGHRFPGNIRELQNLIEYLAVVCDGSVRERDIIEALPRINVPQINGASSMNVPISREVPEGESLSRSVERFEEQLVRDAIARTGSKRKAAKVLGVNIATVVRKSRNPEA
jgi:transcriptional regulator with PAS, ATPase and Fis domain